MPSKYQLREPLTNATYHVVNRDSDRRSIFRDGNDYRRYIRLLAQSLEQEPAISLQAYCLMPNHFHLLVHQAEDARAISRFMRRITIGYVMYFNNRYERVGPLFQGRFRADRIIEPRQLMEVSKYIHLNPLRGGLGWRQYRYSSIDVYLSPFTPDGLVNSGPVLELFDFPEDYERFLYRQYFEMRS